MITDDDWFVDTHGGSFEWSSLCILGDYMFDKAFEDEKRGLGVSAFDDSGRRLAFAVLGSRARAIDQRDAHCKLLERVQNRPFEALGIHIDGHLAFAVHELAARKRTHMPRHHIRLHRLTIHKMSNVKS